MNRDEQRARPKALPPRLGRRGARQVLYPCEPSGGTWIGLNDAGLALALVNWYAQPPNPARRPVSRGEVVRHLLEISRISQIRARLERLPLERMQPFRLIGVSWPGRAVREWAWSGRVLEEGSFSWGRRHWFSSGCDEPGAQRERQAVCDAMSRDKDAGSLAWLRRLHASHLPAPGPYAVCMHRSDAATVSYAEIAVHSRSAAMTYQAGAPCEHGPRASETMLFPRRSGRRQAAAPNGVRISALARQTLRHV